VNASSYSAGWWAGMRAGYRLSRRSLYRRLFVTLCLSAILLGASLGLFWVSWGVFMAQEAGPVVVKSVLSKWEGVAKVMGVKK
jgi:hypothetical protein